MRRAHAPSCTRRVSVAALTAAGLLQDAKAAAARLAASKAEEAAARTALAAAKAQLERVVEKRRALERA